MHSQRISSSHRDLEKALQSSCVTAPPPTSDLRVKAFFTRRRGAAEKRKYRLLDSRRWLCVPNVEGVSQLGEPDGKRREACFYVDLILAIKSNAGHAYIQ